MSYKIRKIKNINPVNITCGVMRALTAAADFEGMNVIHVTITDTTKRHYHIRITECYYVLEGSIDIELGGKGGKVERLEKGSLIMIHPRTSHKAWRVSKKDAEVLVISCPAWNEEDEILEE